MSSLRAPGAMTVGSTLPTPGRAAPSRGLWLAVFACALLIRLAFVAIVPPVILWSDGVQFDAVARDLAEHGTYGMQTLRPPGYPTFMAGVYRVFGENLLALRIVEALLGTVTVVLLGWIASRVFGPRAGWITAALAAFHPVLAFLPATQYSENVAVWVITLGLGGVFWALTGGGMWSFALAGFLFGVAALVRPTAVMMVPGLALGAIFLLRRARKPWLLPLAVAALGMVLAVSPWVMRNHRVHDRWFFVATGGGRQFWFGNNLVTTGTTRVHPEPDPAMMSELMRLPDEFAQEAYFYREGVAFIREHPGRAAWLYLVKMGNLLALYPDTKSQNYMNLWSQGAQTAASLIVYAGALIALRRWRREPLMWVMCGAIASYCLVSALYFSCMRYRMAVEPCLLMMAGIGFGALWDTRRPAHLAAAPAPLGQDPARR